jgi:CheY-like chemotaxis protein
MKHILATCCLLVLACGQPAWAQEPKPAPTPPAVDLEEAARRNPAVAAVLDMPHEAPADALSAALTLLDLREFDVASELLKPVIDANLSAADKAALGRQFGTARIMGLARAATQHNIAGAKEFAQSVLDATAAESTKPETLKELVTNLANIDPTVRHAARNDLAATGVPGVVTALERLAQSTDERERIQLLRGLAQTSPVADPLVIAALAEGQGQFRRDVTELAGHLHLLEAVPWLATIAAGGDSDADVVATAQAALQRMGLPIPDEHDAVATVKRELERIDAGIPADSLPNETGLWWSFDPTTKKLTSVELINCERRSLIYARVAANLLVLPNAAAADRHLAIISAIEAAYVLKQQPSPKIAQLAASLPTTELSAALAAAIKSDRINAAIACANLLAQRADPTALESLDGLSTPLAQAVAHPNRRLKFAALTAIMKLSPNRSFPGASYVPAALWQFAAGAGTEQAVVGAPNPNHANNWAGNLRALGYDATSTFTGIELIQQAVAAPRIALILVDSDIGTPLVREVVYQLRAQPQLAQTPIAVLLASTDLPLGQQLAAADKHLLSVSRPRSPEAMKSIVERLTALGGPPLTAEERTAQARQAVEWLGQLFEAGLPYDELRRDAAILEQVVYNPDLTKVALAALAHVGTAGSQRTLVDFASLESQPLELRQLAATAFAKSRQRYGVLLSTQEIALQYDRYNVSETASAEVQALLGQILDVLEKKSN